MQGNNAKKRKKLNKRQQQKRKLIIFGIEILCLVVLLVSLYIWKLFSKVEIEEGFTNSEAGINTDLEEDTLLTLEGYTNIALFGLDNRSVGNYDTGHSDVIMIASVNNQTKEVRLVSVYRDTYLGVGSGNLNKANNAYYVGGPKQAVQMLNANLDLDITDYACVDWSALIEAIDALGGVELELTSMEVTQVNKYLKDVDKVTGKTTPKLSGEGKMTLDGSQATTYARIRKMVGDDFMRASRQRIVLEAMLNKAKKADIGTLLNICEAVFDDISTSLTLKEILGLAKHVKEYTVASTTGFPFDMTTKTLAISGSTVIPIILEDNVRQLHKFLFDVDDYQPSISVQAVSDAIIEKTGVNENYTSIDTDKFNNTAGQDGTVFDVEEETETETEKGEE